MHRGRRSDRPGRESGRQIQGDRTSLLLDLDQGSMTVYNNDVQLGVMQAEGLSGPLCWAVSLHRLRENSARIESLPTRLRKNVLM